MQFIKRFGVCIAVLSAVVLSGGLQKATANPVYMSSGYGTDGSGSGHMDGQTIVPYRVHNSVQVTPFYNGDNQLIGANWYASLTMEGSLNSDGTITQEMRDLAANQMNIHSHYRINQINFVEGDEYGYYLIDGIAEVILDGSVGANIYTYTDGGGKGVMGLGETFESYVGYMNANVNVNGPGMSIDNISMHFREYQDGNVPKPDWWGGDYAADIDISGYVDFAGGGLGISRVVVPEPASLALLLIGAVAGLRRKK